MTKETITISFKKKNFRIIACIVIIIIGLAFIPSEKEINLPDHEYSKKYDTAISYKSRVYNQNNACLDDAIDSSNWNRDEYKELAAKCKGINTNLDVNLVKFSNGSCNYKPDYGTNATRSDCEIFYIKDGKLYDDIKAERISENKYRERYSSEIDIKPVSGSSITVETYYTKKCHAFGLICSSGEWLDDDTSMHIRLAIGKNVSIKRYNTACDMESGKAMLNEEDCIYADDTYKTITIEDLLKI